MDAQPGGILYLQPFLRGQIKMLFKQIIVLAEYYVLCRSFCFMFRKGTQKSILRYISS